MGTERFTLSWRAIGLAALSTLAAPALAGDINFLSMFRNLSAHQTGDGPSPDPVGAFPSIGATTLGGASYTTAEVVTPAPSTLPLTMQSSTSYGYQTATLPDKTSMDTSFPAGLYVVNLDAVSASFVVGADHYAQSQPYLTGTGWSALQGMDAAAPMTLSLSPFATDAEASDSFIFFTVYDYTAGHSVYDAGALAATTTTVTLPANQLAAGHDYAYEIDFSSRFKAPGSDANYPPQIGYELRTHGEFTTAVPEPGSWLLMLAGIGTLAVRRRRV